MKKTFIFVTCFLSINSFYGVNATPITPTSNELSQQLAAQNNTATPPTQHYPLSDYVPAPPKLNAKAYILIDANSGHIIATKNAQQRIAPASLTKMMSLYILSQALQSGQIHLNDKVRISKKAWQMGGSRMFVKPGSLVSMQNLIDGIIVDSGNDACVAAAEYVAGSEDSFVDLMNQVAAKLNMNGSHFTSSTGLPNKNHYSTPADLALLAQALINDFPEYYSWYQQKWLTYNKIKQPNRNRLLWRDPSVDGIKTGHTQEAGFCLAASALRQNMRLISIVIGSKTDSERASDSQALLNYGFRFFTTKKLYTKNQTIKEIPVWFGQNKYTSLGLAKDLYITLPKTDISALSTQLILKKALEAPIYPGTHYGQLNIYLRNKLIESEDLIALEANPEGSWFSKLEDHIARFFKNYT